MRQLSALFIVAALFGASGFAAAQVFSRQPHDISAEWRGDTSDPNGLPLPAGNSIPRLILDTKVFLGSNVAATQPLGSDQGLAYNEWIVPLVFSDSSGARTKTFLLPGVNRFHAWYGEWDDKNNDKSILASGDASDEWTGWNETLTPDKMYLFINPGYYASATSDCYILAGYVISNQCQDDFQANNSDIEMLHRGDGNWTGVSILPMLDGSLIETKTVATVANGLLAPSQFPGYGCGSNANCSIDVDRYDILNQDVSDLYGLVIDAANNGVNEIYDNATEQCYSAGACQYVDMVDALGAALLTRGLNAVAPPTDNEANNEINASYAYASMTSAHGANRTANGYAYHLGPHAFANLRASAYYTEPNAVGTVSWFTPGVPANPELEARGWSPQMVGIQGDVGIWYDANDDDEGWSFTADGDDAGEWTGTCLLVDASDPTKAVNLTATMIPVNGDGSLGSWGPYGAYVFDEAEGPDVVVADEEIDPIWYDEVILDVLDGNVDNWKHGSEPITTTLYCDNDDPGDWFSSAWQPNAVNVFFPMGNHGFNILLTMDDNIAVKYKDPILGEVVERVKDIDLYPRWDKHINP